jgi:hypothetical protein
VPLPWAILPNDGLECFQLQQSAARYQQQHHNDDNATISKDGPAGGGGGGGNGTLFFDSFLFVGTEWYNSVKFNWERAYVNDSSFKNQRHAVMTDWLGLLGVFSRHVQNLETAAAQTDTHPTFVITIPYPDKRATSWGAIPTPTQQQQQKGDGGGTGTGGAPRRVLNFSKAADQVAGVNWYVDHVVATMAGLKLKRSKLIGFYWYGLSV